MNQPEINSAFFNCFGKLHRRHRPATAIVIHHTCTATPAKTRKALLGKGYSTHFEVDTDGTIYQYAPIDRVCCHCGSANIHTIGIDVTHRKDADFPEVQCRAVESLVSWLCAETGIPQIVYAGRRVRQGEKLSGIYPHRALGNTDCPQNFPMERLNGDGNSSDTSGLAGLAAREAQQ